MHNQKEEGGNMHNQKEEVNIHECHRTEPPCEHTKLEYCRKCGKVYCKDCGKEWFSKPEYIYVPYVTYTYKGA